MKYERSELDYCASKRTISFKGTCASSAGEPLYGSLLVCYAFLRQGKLFLDILIPNIHISGFTFDPPCLRAFSPGLDHQFRGFDYGFFDRRRFLKRRGLDDGLRQLLARHCSRFASKDQISSTSGDYHLLAGFASYFSFASVESRQGTPIDPADRRRMRLARRLSERFRRKKAFSEVLRFSLCCSLKRASMRDFNVCFFSELASA